MTPSFVFLQYYRILHTFVHLVRFFFSNSITELNYVFYSRYNCPKYLTLFTEPSASCLAQDIGMALPKCADAHGALTTV